MIIDEWNLRTSTHRESYTPLVQVLFCLWIIFLFVDYGAAIPSFSQPINTHTQSSSCWNFTYGNNRGHHFYSPGYPKNYPNRTECRQVLVGEWHKSYVHFHHWLQPLNIWWWKEKQWRHDVFGCKTLSILVPVGKPFHVLHWREFHTKCHSVMICSQSQRLLQYSAISTRSVLV